MSPISLSLSLPFSSFLSPSFCFLTFSLEKAIICLFVFLKTGFKSVMNDLVISKKKKLGRKKFSWFNARDPWYKTLRIRYCGHDTFASLANPIVFWHFRTTSIVWAGNLTNWICSCGSVNLFYRPRLGRGFRKQTLLCRISESLTDPKSRINMNCLDRIWS